MIKKLKLVVIPVLVFLLAFQQSGIAQVAPQLFPAAADKFRPAHLRFVSLAPDGLSFNLMVDKGDEQGLSEQQVKAAASSLMEYFYTGLALPDSDFWVNLRPDTTVNIIDPALERTDLGKMLLQADVQLKKDLSALTSPQTKEGRQYWDKLYAKASRIFKDEHVRIPTVSRPWIVPGEVVLKEFPEGVYIYKALLKVRIEQDYVRGSRAYEAGEPRLKQLNDYSAQLIRELILPRLTREVNSARRYAGLRQVFFSLILAQWVKTKMIGKLPASLSSQVEKGGLEGLESKSSWSKDFYYTAYKKSFDEGEYDYTEQTTALGGVYQRRYFCGGILPVPDSQTVRVVVQGSAFLPADDAVFLKSSRDGGLDEIEDPGFSEVTRAVPAPAAYSGTVFDLAGGKGAVRVHVMDKEAADGSGNQPRKMVDGRFYDFYASGASDMYIVPKFGLSAIERESSFQMRMELQRHISGFAATDTTPDFIIKVLSETHRAALGQPWLTEEDLIAILLANSQVRFERQVNAYMTGSSYDPYSNRIGSPEYSHIKHFGYLYAREVSRLREIMAGNRGKTLSVLDLGTGLANVLLTIHASLSEEERKLVRLYGIDASERDMSIARNYSEARNLGIVFKRINVERPDWMERTKELNGGKKFDLVIANHVLEHLDTVNPPEYYIRQWATLGNNLAVSIPMNEPDESFKLSGHQFRFDEQQIGAIGENLGKEGAAVDLKNSACGLMFISPNIVKDGGNIERIKEIYESVTGKDVFRFKGEKPRGLFVTPEQIQASLAVIRSRGGYYGHISSELATALKYSEGILDEKGYQMPIQPVQLYELATQWKSVEEELRSALPGIADSFAEGWIEYALFLRLRALAQSLTGRDDVDSYGGSRSGDKQKEKEAFNYYVLADLVALKSVNELMRISGEEIRGLIAANRWELLANYAVLARLHGEGKFLSSLAVYMDRMPRQLRDEFERTVAVFESNTERGYRRGVPAAEIDGRAVADQLRRLSAAAREFSGKTGEVDFDKDLLRLSQRDVRDAETHCAQVEELYARKGEGRTSGAASGSVSQMYKDAVISFLEDMEAVYRGAALIDGALARFRERLIQCRASADRQYGNDYYWWTGAGEPLQQMKVRANHPREQLYSIEAFAERLYFSAASSARQSTQSNTALTQDMVDREFASSAACFVQEWVNYYGPRRSGIFGRAPPSHHAINAEISRVDSDVRAVVEMVRNKGGDPALWGWLYGGFTDRLRYMISRKHITVQQSEELIARGGVRALEERMLAFPGHADDAVVIGVHVHNVDINTLRETMSHAREAGWKHDNKWVVLGTDTSDMGIAEAERRLAIEHGFTRYAVSARRHLKAGNQNRIMPNVPRSKNGESFYLTLDDDYSPASTILYRVIPLMVEHDAVPFVQIPLYFRANSEAGYSRARKLDASLVYSSYVLFFSGLNDLSRKGSGSLQKGQRDSLVTPFGTGTVFRLTPGRNILDDTGYFPVGTSAEDTALGVVYYLKTRLDIYAEKMKSKAGDGVYLNEMLVKGDSVEYHGREAQQIRWAEGGTRMLLLSVRHIMKSLITTGGIGRVSPRMVINGLFSFGSYIQMSVLSFVAFIGVPLSILVFGVPVMNVFTVGVLACVVVPLFTQMFLSPYYGISLKEQLAYVALHFYGAASSIWRGVGQAFLGEPTKWFANKSSRSSYLTMGNAANAAILLLNAAAAARIIAAGGAGVIAIPVFALINISAFVYLFYLQKSTPTDHRKRAEWMDEEFKSGFRGIPSLYKYNKIAAIPRFTELLLIVSGVFSMTGIGLGIAGILSGVNLVTGVMLGQSVFYSIASMYFLYSNSNALKAIRTGRLSPEQQTETPAGILTISSPRKDGGAPGGVDMSETLAEARAGVGMPPVPASILLMNASLKDLGKEWTQIKVQIISGQVPYSRLQQYAATCASRPDTADQLKEVSGYIARMLKMEEEKAVETAPEMAAILSCL